MRFPLRCFFLSPFSHRVTLRKQHDPRPYTVVYRMHVRVVVAIVCLAAVGLLTELRCYFTF